MVIFAKFERVEKFVLPQIKRKTCSPKILAKTTNKLFIIIVRRDGLTAKNNNIIETTAKYIKSTKTYVTIDDNKI